MTLVYGERKTLDPANQFSIVCPIFKAQTKLAACFALRDLWARGECPPTRRGCQVALDAGKCPIEHILQSMRLQGDDPYHSKEAKVGTLRATILERIAPVLVLEKAIERANVSPKEAEYLLKANEDARKGVGRAVKKARRADPDMTQLEITDTMAVVVPDTAIAKAAKSGDMTAAVNAAIKDTGVTK